MILIEYQCEVSTRLTGKKLTNKSNKNGGKQ